MKVITNVPGWNSRSRARTQDFLSSLRYLLRAGPFGGCAAVTNAKAAAKVKSVVLSFHFRREITVVEAEAALAEDLKRRLVLVNKK
ncbi:hypothetical protein FRC11_009360 [Ceratobasidium sp. 423]|nr:hypothetical protein FRC11_009360 [Ceratobasidium sp. 423]